MLNPDRPLLDYAHKEAVDIAKDLQSSTNGLSDQQATLRLKQFGLNKVTDESHRHWLVQYLSNFKNPLVLILLFAAAVSFALGQIIDASIITIIIFFSTTINFIQEYDANKAAEELKSRVSTVAKVIRSGHEQKVPAVHLVMGDLITFNAGDVVSADARVIESEDFFINQSTLTGESFPVEKTEKVISARNGSFSEMENIVFAGTSVVTGSAKAIVIRTGRHTEFGKIAVSLTEPATQNEFTTGVKNFSLLIMRITIFFVLFIFLFSIGVKHDDFLEAFTFAIAVAVGLTPELLPVIMSVTMANGSIRMAKKGVIVKKLAAIPDFGEMDVLCTDKTGTLTQDKIVLVKYIDAAGKNSEKVLLHAYLNSSYQTGIKNPMDDAILHYRKEDISQFKKIDEIPFDFDRRKMSVIVENQGHHYMITKGAPEEIFKVSSHYQHTRKETFTESVQKAAQNQYHHLSQQGFRVLGLSVKPLSVKKKKYSKEDEKQMSFLGFIAFLDPAKQGVKRVIGELEQMGIEIKVITGDNQLVTQKIIDEVGLLSKGVVMGNEIDQMPRNALQLAVENNTVFARCSPEQKNKILLALKQNGHVIGYMGDGINDAPSLKTADVGISVQNGVDVAKESADMILTHKSLEQLKDGVLEGRRTFTNTMKYIMMGLSSNFGNMFSVLSAVLFLPFLPMLPIQILLNNLLYDTSQIAIPSDRVDAETLQRPRKWDLKFVRNSMFIFGPISSVFDFLAFFLLFWIFKSDAATFHTGWFIESLATQTLVIHSIRTRYLPFIQSRASIYLIATTVLVVIIGWTIPFTPVGAFFGFTRLPWTIMAAMAGVVILYIIGIEIGKRIFYRYQLNSFSK